MPPHSREASPFSHPFSTLPIFSSTRTCNLGLEISQSTLGFLGPSSSESASSSHPIPCCPKSPLPYTKAVRGASSAGVGLGMSKSKAEWRGKGSNRLVMGLMPTMGARLGLALMARGPAAAFLRGAAALVLGALRLREPEAVEAPSSDSSSLSSSTGEAARPLFLAAAFLTGTALALGLEGDWLMERLGTMEGREERRGVPAGAAAAEATEAERAPAN